MGFGWGRLLEAKWKGGGVGAYSPFLPLGWAQIRGWALIRINTVAELRQAELRQRKQLCQTATYY